MKKIYDFKLFLESKQESSDVRKEVKKIVSEMFAVGKGITFSGDQNGNPEFVDFEINEDDFKLDYKGEDMKLDYSEGVLKKREFEVSLKFDSKYKEGDKNSPIYKIRFKIILKPTSEIEFKKELVGWLFEKKPVKVLKFIKSSRQSCEWNDDTKVLTMPKSGFNKMDNDYLKILISDAGGEKVRV